jgi:hypothetical protein
MKNGTCLIKHSPPVLPAGVRAHAPCPHSLCCRMVLVPCHLGTHVCIYTNLHPCIAKSCLRARVHTHTRASQRTICQYSLPSTLGAVGEASSSPPVST